MIELATQFLDFIRHLDVHLENIMRDYQLLTYLLLALIIFCETGLVVTPFLPGDSLLFAAGAITAKTGILNVWLLIPLLFFAAILGDNTNYFFGRYLGNKVFTRDYWFLKRAYIERTQEFYEKYGGRTLVIARFVPIVRTFAPFVAGVGEMPLNIGLLSIASKDKKKFHLLPDQTLKPREPGQQHLFRHQPLLHKGGEPASPLPFLHLSQRIGGPL